LTPSGRPKLRLLLPQKRQRLHRHQLQRLRLPWRQFLRQRSRLPPPYLNLSPLWKLRQKYRLNLKRTPPRHLHRYLKLKRQKQSPLQ